MVWYEKRADVPRAYLSRRSVVLRYHRAAAATRPARWYGVFNNCCLRAVGERISRTSRIATDNGSRASPCTYADRETTTVRVCRLLAVQSSRVCCADAAFPPPPAPRCGLNRSTAVIPPQAGGRPSSTRHHHHHHHPPHRRLPRSPSLSETVTRAPQSTADHGRLLIYLTITTAPKRYRNVRRSRRRVLCFIDTSSVGPRRIFSLGK